MKMLSQLVLTCNTGLEINSDSGSAARLAAGLLAVKESAAEVRKLYLLKHHFGIESVLYA